MSKITYKPNFDYEKDYSTIGTPYQEATESITQDSSASPDVFLNIYNQTNDHISNINSQLILLPSELTSIIVSFLSGMNYIQNIIKPDNSNTPSSPVVPDSNTQNNNQSDNSINDNNSPKPTLGINKPSTYFQSIKKALGKTKKVSLPTNLFADTPNISATIKAPTIYDAYHEILNMINNNAASKLNSAINRLILNTIPFSDLSAVLNYKDDYKKHTKEVNDSSLYHCSDIIIRDKTLYDQKVRLARKLFDFNNFLIHYASLDASKKFLDRYNSEHLKYNNTLKNQYINDSLIATRKQYEQKYINNIENIDRYFNSGIDILGDCMDMISRKAVMETLISETDQ